MTVPRYTPFKVRFGPVGDPVPEATPTFTLDREIERAKREMGPKRWAELQAEWERKS